ncbi:MAG TPA: hypothetical protein PK720_04450 [bacterium]|nr:hypothetical protein [bacterium]
MQHGTGLKRDPKDSRDKKYDHLALATSLFDWEKGYDVEEELGFKLPTKDQGGSMSCVGQATATYAYVKNAFELKPVYRDKTQQHLDELSAKSVYSQISLGYGVGAYLRDGVKLLKSMGVVTEKDVPSYVNGRVPDEKFMIDRSWVNEELISKAKNLQASEYRVIHNITIDSIAAAIRDNQGLLMGVQGSNNGTWSNLFPLPPKTGEDRWGHAIYGGKARLINGKKYIGKKNSWGENVGADGWQWYGEEWFKEDFLFNPWVVVDQANLKWVHMIDKNGEARTFPTYFLRTIRYMEKLGFKLI